MRILAVIVGTFAALFGLAFGGCAVTWLTVVLRYGMPDMAPVWLIMVNTVLATLLLGAAYRLFRGPGRSRASHEDEPVP